MMFRKYIIFVLVFFLLQFHIVNSFAAEINANDFNTDKKLYLKIENVNPFGDYENYKKIADYLNEESIPYVIVVMPVFVNTDLPEMKNFMGVVRYMQKQGGTVILHSLLNGNVDYQSVSQGALSTEKESAYERIQKSVQVYADNGIYVLGLEASDSIINSADYEKIKKGFSRVFEQKDKNENDLSKLTSMKAYTEAVSFEPDDNINVLKSLVSSSRKDELEFSDLSDEKSQVNLDGVKIICDSGQVTLNGQYVSLKNGPQAAVKEQSSSINQTSGNNTKESVVNSSIKSINRFMVIVVGTLCIVLFLFYINGKRINKRKFLR